MPSSDHTVADDSNSLVDRKIDSECGSPKNVKPRF